jgi:hypothetical protein
LWIEDCGIAGFGVDYGAMRFRDGQETVYARGRGEDVGVKSKEKLQAGILGRRRQKQCKQAGTPSGSDERTGLKIVEERDVSPAIDDSGPSVQIAIFGLRREYVTVASPI